MLPWIKILGTPEFECASLIQATLLEVNLDHVLQVERSLEAKLIEEVQVKAMEEKDVKTLVMERKGNRSGALRGLWTKSTQFWVRKPTRPNN